MGSCKPFRQERQRKIEGEVAQAVPLMFPLKFIEPNTSPSHTHTQPQMKTKKGRELIWAFFGVEGCMGGGSTGLYEK